MSAAIAGTRAALLAAIVVGAAACASPPQSDPAPAKADPAANALAGGKADAVFVVGEKTTRLTYAYAVILPGRRGKGAEETKVILADRALSREALEKQVELARQVRNDEAAAVEVYLVNGRAGEAFLHHPGLPAGLSLTEVHSFTPSATGDGALAGTLRMSGEGYSFRYEGTFAAPIWRAPARPALNVPAGATAAERARAELARDGVAFTDEEFLDAVFEGDTELVQTFLDAGMPARTRGPRGTALKDAVERGHAAIVDALLAAGADAKERETEYKTTLVMNATDRDDPRILQALVRAGGDVNAGNQWKIGPLAVAAERGNVPMVRAILAAGARVDAPSTSGTTPIQVAALRGHVEVVKLLIAAGADVVKQKKELVQYAEQEGHAEVKRIVLEAASKKPKPPRPK